MHVKKVEQLMLHIMHVVATGVVEDRESAAASLAAAFAFLRAFLFIFTYLVGGVASVPVFSNRWTVAISSVVVEPLI